MFAIAGTDKIKDATTALVSEALKIKKFGFTQAELDRAKASVLASYEKSYNERDKTESRTRVDELVRHFLTNEPVPGIAWEYEIAKTDLPKITLNDVKQPEKPDRYRSDLLCTGNYENCRQTSFGCRSEILCGCSAEQPGNCLRRKRIA
ncbi:MAG: hypothetical protein QM743_12485 [Chitinophagaceae bacterium]